MEEEEKELSQSKVLIGSFMNILKNLQQFYEVYTDTETVDWSAKEKTRRRIAEKCYKLNTQYIQKQLESIRQNISNKNLKIYSTIKHEIEEILEKYAI
jgi:membrane peptidoglycan carboxypeptidase